MLELHWYATSLGGGPLVSWDAYATVDMKTISAHQAPRRQFMPGGSRDPLPEGPLDDRHPEEERADRDDRGMCARAAADRRQGQEEGEDP